MKRKTLSLLTPQGAKLSGTPWDIYPRPQLKRDSFICLNGEWDFSVDEGEKRKILVPFAPESLLSGLEIEVKSGALMHYCRYFTLPEGFLKEKVLLHFGAVDQVARICVNGHEVGCHIGGYDAFSFDVTPYLQDENLLEVFVTDDLTDHILPYGKQRFDRGGMWYTPVSGIWQTVWLESVPEEYIEDLRIDVTLDYVSIKVDGVDRGEVAICTPYGDLTGELRDGRFEAMITNPRLWTPDDPYLYHFTISTGNDRVESYFALRTVTTEVVDGTPRLCLNGKPYFFHGVLDQGYFSDGIYTPATPDCYEFDILSMKKLGFNMLRKHIKVEPEQFYYDCDRLGMVVFQDMVNNGDYSFIHDTVLPTIGMQKIKDTRLHLDKETRKAFEDGMEKTVRQLYNHPSICYWTIFNEGWGQFDSQRMYEKMLTLDTSRVIDTTSGWFRCSESHVESLHIYFKPVRVKKAEKPLVLSEFGGYSYKVMDHSFNPYKTYGYGKFKSQTDFENAVLNLYDQQVIPAIRAGLCATVYTQVSDVEDETNGFLTYDRAVVKVDETAMQQMSGRVYEAFSEATR